MNEKFPPGNAAYQERYLAAFRGLTDLLSSDDSEKYDIWHIAPKTTYVKQWKQMFEALIAVEQEEED